MERRAFLKSFVAASIAGLNFDLFRGLAEGFMRVDEEFSGSLLTTGYENIDRLIGGFYPGELTIVGSRPEISKLSLLTGIARHAAVDQKRKVAFFCPHITREQLLLRMLREECRVTSCDKKKEGVSKLAHSTGCLKDAPIFIDDADSISVSEILERARLLAARKGLDIVVISSSQLLKCGHHVHNQAEAIGMFVKVLKKAAAQLQVPIVAACTMRTPVGDKPTISDIGFVESYADTVIFLHRDNISLPIFEAFSEISTDVIIAKNRRGATRSISLNYIWGADGTSAYENINYVKGSV